MYKGSSALEIRGYPDKPKLKELLKSALFFYQITNEETLITQLIKEGQRCLDEKRYDEALFLYGEAMLMDKWKPLYGGSLLANLAYI